VSRPQQASRREVDTLDDMGAEWIPLWVALVAAIGAFSVAYWNSRGESAQLRQLRSMNEVLTGLPNGEHSTEAFKVARDALALQVAQRVVGPSRAGQVWSWIAMVVSVGMGAVWSIWWRTLSPTDAQPWILAVATVAGLGAGVASGIAVRRSRQARTLEQKRMRDLVYRLSSEPYFTRVVE